MTSHLNLTIPALMAVAVLTWSTLTLPEKQAATKEAKAAAEPRPAADETDAARGLRLAQILNAKGISTQAQAKEQGVDCNCTEDMAEAMLDLLVKPAPKDEPQALHACLVLALAAEQDRFLRSRIFTALGRHCRQMRPRVFSWMLERMLLNNRNCKAPILQLIRKVEGMDAWPQQPDIRAALWDAYAYRLEYGDIDRLRPLLQSPAMDAQLARKLARRIVEYMEATESAPQRESMGSMLFRSVPAQYRPLFTEAFARSGSAEALAFYKQELQTAGLRRDGPRERLQNALSFFAAFDGEVITYLHELKQQAGDSLLFRQHLDTAMQLSLARNCERSQDELATLLPLAYGKLDGKGDEARRQKTLLLYNLAQLRDYPWVTGLLQNYSRDADPDIARKAARALQQVRQNAQDHAALRERYAATE